MLIVSWEKNIVLDVVCRISSLRGVSMGHFYHCFSSFLIFLIIAFHCSLLTYLYLPSISVFTSMCIYTLRPTKWCVFTIYSLICVIYHQLVYYVILFPYFSLPFFCFISPSTEAVHHDGHLPCQLPLSFSGWQASRQGRPPYRWHFAPLPLSYILYYQRAIFTLFDEEIENHAVSFLYSIPPSSNTPDEAVLTVPDYGAAPDNPRHHEMALRSSRLSPIPWCNASRRPLQVSPEAAYRQAEAYGNQKYWQLYKKLRRGRGIQKNLNA